MLSLWDLPREIAMFLLVGVILFSVSVRVVKVVILIVLNFSSSGRNIRPRRESLTLNIGRRYASTA